MSTTTKAVETLTMPTPEAPRRPGRPAVYTPEQVKERARAATKRSVQRRINKNAADLDNAAEALTTINISRLSKEDKALVASALQGIANVRAGLKVKPVEVPDTEWGNIDTEAEAPVAEAEPETETTDEADETVADWTQA